MWKFTVILFVAVMCVCAEEDQPKNGKKKPCVILCNVPFISSIVP